MKQKDYKPNKDTRQKLEKYFNRNENHVKPTQSGATRVKKR